VRSQSNTALKKIAVPRSSRSQVGAHLPLQCRYRLGWRIRSYAVFQVLTSSASRKSRGATAVPSRFFHSKAAVRKLGGGGLPKVRPLRNPVATSAAPVHRRSVTFGNRCHLAELKPITQRLDAGTTARKAGDQFLRHSISNAHVPPGGDSRTLGERIRLAMLRLARVLKILVSVVRFRPGPPRIIPYKTPTHAGWRFCFVDRKSSCPVHFRTRNPRVLEAKPTKSSKRPPRSLSRFSKVSRLLGPPHDSARPDLQKGKGSPSRSRLILENPPASLSHAIP
jgi:hypothetical protein